MANYYASIELIKNGAESDNFTNLQSVLKQIFYLTGSPSIYLLENNLNNYEVLPKELQDVARQVKSAKNLKDVLNAVENTEGVSSCFYLADMYYNLWNNINNNNNNVYGL